MTSFLICDYTSKNPHLCMLPSYSLPKEKSMHDLNVRVKIQPFSSKVIAVGYRKRQTQKCWQVPACSWFPYPTYGCFQQPVLLMEPQTPCHMQGQQTSATPLLLPTPSTGGTSFPKSLCKFQFVHSHQCFRSCRTDCSLISYNSPLQTLTSSVSQIM